MTAAKKISDEMPDLADQIEVKEGKPDSLRNTILNFVSRDKFDLAIRELRYYEEYKSNLTVFKDRTSRFFDHCEELIQAIKTKKSFPNFDALPMAKRKEITDRIQSHFNELQQIINRIEQIENDIKVQDARSTLWVVRSFIVSVTVVTVWTVMLEAVRTMGLSFTVILSDLASLFFHLLGI